MTRSSPTIADLTCPFCGLHCDDLTVVPGTGAPRVSAAGCDRAAAGFAQLPIVQKPAVRGRSTTLEVAVAHAAQILRRARQPLIGGMAADAAGCRAAMALAERAGAAVDHMHGPAIAANMQVLQRRGWIMTTLTEVRNRADLVVLFGTDGDSVNPRFTARCLAPAPGPAGGRRRPRQVVFIGEPAPGRAVRRALPGSIVIPSRRQDYIETLWSLRALLLDQPAPAGRRAAGLRDLAARLRAARYAVVAWAPGQLPADCADILIETLCELVTTLNGHTRAAGLALGGNDGATTAVNVCAWQTGYPLRVNFAGGAPAYDPARNAAEALLERGEADALVWISTFEPQPPPVTRGLPVVALTPASRRIAALAEVHIPVAIPGVDAPGTVFRLDSVVGLPLRAVRPATAPTAADVLNRIRAHL